jgi:hypothetical protein
MVKQRSYGSKIGWTEGRVPKFCTFRANDNQSVRLPG